MSTKQITKRQAEFALLPVKEKRANPQIVHSGKLGFTLCATTRIELHPSESVTTRTPTFRCAVLFRDAVVAQFKPTRSTSERTRKLLLKKATDFITDIAKDFECDAICVSEESLQYNFRPEKMESNYILGAYTPDGVRMPTFEK